MFSRVMNALHPVITLGSIILTVGYFVTGQYGWATSQSVISAVLFYQLVTY